MILLTPLLLLTAAMNAPETRTLSPIIAKYLKEKAPLPCLDGIAMPELRRRFNERQKSFNASLPTYDVTIENSLAKTSVGEIALRIYRPQSKSLLPVIVFFHGGGFVFGDLDTLESYCRQIAHQVNALVISVDYPLAPENPFPAAPHACYATTSWIQKHLSQWKGDPQRLFIGGSSAGANLAAVVCLMAREKNGPKIKGQILLCPLVDADFDTLSYHENASGYGITRDQLIWFLSQYAPNHSDYENLLLLPLRAKSFDGLPPAMIVTAEFDPVRDEGRAFARKLKEAGIPCKDLCYRGMIHGFYTLNLGLSETQDVLNQMRDFVNK